MLRRLISDAKYYFKEMYEDLKFDWSKPVAEYPFINADVPSLEKKIHTLEQQHALAKEARKILQRR
jgi:cell division protein FtsB